MIVVRTPPKKFSATATATIVVGDGCVVVSQQTAATGITRSAAATATAGRSGQRVATRPPTNEPVSEAPIPTVETQKPTCATENPASIRNGLNIASTSCSPVL